MTSIFVAKLDFGVDNQQLQSLFETYGKVNKATVALDRETGKSRGFGFVEMFNDDEAQEAISQLDGYTVNNREIAVKQAEDRSNSRGPAPRRDAPNPRRDSGDSRPPSRSDGPPTPPATPDATPVKEFSKKKSFKSKSPSFDSPQDRGGRKETKLNPYKKSGKDTIKFDDEDFDDEDFDLFGRNEDEDDDEDYSKYLVNADDDDEDYDDEDFDDDEDYEEED